MAATTHKRVLRNTFVLLVFAHAVQALRCTGLPLCNCLDDNTKVNCENKNLTKVPQGFPVGAEEIIMDYNSIAQITAEPFSSLVHLKILSLYGNKLQVISNNTFPGTSLTSLRELWLDKNLITAIDSSLISNLEHIEVLSLNGNKLTDINTFTGASLPTLSRLLLNHNSISTFDARALNGMKNIKQVWLAGNRLTEIINDTFSAGTSLSNLNVLCLSSNLICAIEPRVFSVMNNLQQLLLNGNSLIQINAHAFSGLTRLETLDLSRNAIDFIHKNTFDDLGHLKKIKLGHNRLTTVPAIGVPSYLQTIDLSNNSIRNATFPATFLESNNLKNINMRFNNIRYIEKTMFNMLTKAPRLSVVLSENPISLGTDFVVNCYKGKLTIKIDRYQLNAKVMKGCVDNIAESGVDSLVVTGMNGPFIEHTFRSMLNRYIDTVKISHCDIQTLGRNAFVGLNKVTTIVLNHCQITSIESGALNDLSDLTVLDLTRNELTSIEWQLPRTVEKLIMNDNNISCISWHSISSRKATLGVSNTKQIFGLDRLQELHLKHNKIGTCQTFKLKHLLQHFVNLRSLNLANNEIKRISYERNTSQILELSYLDLSDNLMESLQANMFEGLISLQHLHLERNDVMNICKDAFIGLSRLRELHLTSNNVKHLHVASFEHLYTLILLKLDDNDIASLNGNIFRPTHNLLGLDLANNSIYKAVHLDSLSSTLQWVNLTGNKLVCDCELLSFRDWIAQSSNIFTTYKSYKCHAPEEWRDKPITSFSKTKLECMLSESWPFFLGSTVVALFVIAVGIVSYKKRWGIKLCFYKMAHKRKARHQQNMNARLIDDDDGPPMFDAYISYADADCGWVQDHLLPGVDLDVEGGGQFRLYYGRRDANPALSVIGNIFENLSISRKVVVVLSQSYLNPMNEFELDLATKLMYERAIEGLVMVYSQQGLPKEIIPAHLVHTMKRNKVLEWTDHPNAQTLLTEQLVGILAERDVR